MVSSTLVAPTLTRSSLLRSLLADSIGIQDFDWKRGQWTFVSRTAARTYADNSLWIHQIELDIESDWKVSPCPCRALVDSFASDLPLWR